MQDNGVRKTLTFVLVAAIAVLVGWEPWRPKPSANDAPAVVGTKLFPDFTDPLVAKSLEIVTFDERTATIDDFKVAQVNGVWSIPSHSNYPADAQEHMAQAAAALLNIEILGVSSSSPGDQELYGVIAPDPSKLRPGNQGVGMRVTLKDGKDRVLADLVIGKEVKDQPTQRYVRRADRDQIYTVIVKTDKLSTKFGDWIEKDLLKLNAFDVREVELNDYSLTEGLSREGGIAVRIKRRSRMKLAYDDAKSTWSLVDMSEFDPKGEPIPVKLAEDEELNNEKLNGLKTALDDLQIVDVQRKPQGLSQDLRASEDFVKDNEAQVSLMERGFFPIPMGESYEIFSSEGEATCTTKDGVKYVLRFGRLAGGEEAKREAKEGDKEKSNPALNRYLFVMAQFDESQIPKPQLESVPGGEQPAAAAPAAGQEGEKKDAAEPAADKPAPEEKTAAQEGKADDAKSADAKADDAKTEAAATDKKEGEKKEEKPAAAPSDEQRIAVEKENKRRQDEYDSAVKKGQAKVKELNDRFSDWYFIISDDVYNKIHLSRADVVKKKEAADKDKIEGPGALKELEKGLKPQ